MQLIDLACGMDDTSYHICVCSGWRSLSHLSLHVALHDRSSAQSSNMSRVLRKRCAAAFVVGVCGVGMRICGKMCLL